jgi:hypothetical protein
MTVWIYVDTSKQVGDPEHLKVFASQDAAEAWFAENDPEGVAFEYEVINEGDTPDPPRGHRLSAIRIIKHEAVPDCGSFEVRFPDDRPSQYFYWDDIPARRMRPETLDRETALEKAKAVARTAESRLREG